ncbi:unnamed protein product [Somion occarium]|uniref:Uncharacterized protein n=1 Tax=Somion occarium TaxID=3059160 RepID=A0ABP1CGL5_9APHY
MNWIYRLPFTTAPSATLLPILDLRNLHHHSSTNFVDRSSSDPWAAVPSRLGLVRIGHLSNLIWRIQERLSNAMPSLSSCASRPGPPRSTFRPAGYETPFSTEHVTASILVQCLKMSKPPSVLSFVTVFFSKYSGSSSTQIPPGYLHKVVPIATV